MCLLQIRRRSIESVDQGRERTARMSSAKDVKAPSEAPKFTEGHAVPLKGLDIYMGGFCVYMAIVAAVGYWRGDVTLLTPIVIILFVFSQWAYSAVSYRAKDPKRIELYRIALGTIISPMTFVGSGGHMAMWW